MPSLARRHVQPIDSVARLALISPAAADRAHHELLRTRIELPPITAVPVGSGPADDDVEATLVIEGQGIEIALLERGPELPRAQGIRTELRENQQARAASFSLETVDAGAVDHDRFVDRVGVGLKDILGETDLGHEHRMAAVPDHGIG